MHARKQCFRQTRLNRGRNRDDLVAMVVRISPAPEIETRFVTDAVVEPVLRLPDFLFRVGRKLFDQVFEQNGHGFTPCSSLATRHCFAGTIERPFGASMANSRFSPAKRSVLASSSYAASTSRRVRYSPCSLSSRSFRTRNVSLGKLGPKMSLGSR